jgi:cytochrome c oxidase subunit 3
MLLFITSEVMFFAGLFAAYFNVRANSPQWPPINAETGEAFHVEILPLVGPATVLLILSSFTCQYAVWAIRRGTGPPS